VASPVLTYTVDAHRVEPGVSSARTRKAEIRVDTDLSPFHDDSASARVALEREDRPPRIAPIQHQLRLATDEPAHGVEPLRRNLTTFGKIHNALAATCQLTGEIVVDAVDAEGPIGRHAPGSNNAG